MKPRYKQCVLERTLKIKNCVARQTSWIPEKFAKIDEVLKLKENDIWEDGWIVVLVGGEVLDEADLPDAHKTKKVHRKRTGDSLPKNG